MPFDAFKINASPGLKIAQVAQVPGNSCGNHFDIKLRKCERKVSMEHLYDIRDFRNKEERLRSTLNALNPLCVSAFLELFPASHNAQAY